MKKRKKLALSSLELDRRQHLNSRTVFGLLPDLLSPATARTKSIRLHQVWRPVRELDADEPDRDRDEPVASGSRPRLVDPGATAGADQAGTATRIALRPHDPTTGEAIDKSEIVKGYEYDRGEFVPFTADELKALDVESPKVVNLETFVPRGAIDPVYRDSPYYLYPDGAIAVKVLCVISAAMTASGVAGIGRLTLSRRKRMVMVEPRGPGMALFTLRAADEVRTPQLATMRAISMPRWSRSPARSSDCAPDDLTRARTATGIKRRCVR